MAAIAQQNNFNLWPKQHESTETICSKFWQPYGGSGENPLRPESLWSVYPSVQNRLQGLSPTPLSLARNN